VRVEGSQRVREFGERDVMSVESFGRVERLL